MNCFKLAINPKNDNDVINSDITLSPDFFDVALFPSLKFSYRSKFHVNIITSSRVTVIFLYKGLTRNFEIGNTPIGFFPNIWRLGQVRNTQFVKNVTNEILLNAAKCYIYSFYLFWVIKEKLAGVGKIIPCVFHFVEIQSVFYPYLQSGLDVVICQLWSKFLLKHFNTPTLASANCSYSLINITDKFLDMIWILNIHWGYFFLKCILDGKFCTVLLPNLL